MPSPTDPASSPAAAVPTRDEVIAEIQRVCREELELERALSASDDLLKDLELDSMGLIVVAVGVENRFRVKLSEEDSVGVRTVGELAELVVRRAMEARA